MEVTLHPMQRINNVEQEEPIRDRPACMPIRILSHHEDGLVPLAQALQEKTSLGRLGDTQRRATA